MQFGCLNVVGWVLAHRAKIDGGNYYENGVKKRRLLARCTHTALFLQTNWPVVDIR